MLQDNLVNKVTADALAPCITKSPAAMVLYKQDKQVLVFWMEKFQLPEHSQCSEIRQVTNIDGLVQDCSNSIANALELLQSCTKPSNYIFYVFSEKYSITDMSILPLLFDTGCQVDYLVIPQRYMKQSSWWASLTLCNISSGSVLPYPH